MSNFGTYEYLHFAAEGDDLVITLTPEGEEFVREAYADAEELGEYNPADVFLFREMFEDVEGSSEMLFFEESPWGLTGSPVISDGVYYGDDGELAVYEGAKAWWYPNYAVSDFVEEMYARGHVVFTYSGPFEE